MARLKAYMLSLVPGETGVLVENALFDLATTVSSYIVSVRGSNQSCIGYNQCDRVSRWANRTAVFKVLINLANLY